MGRSQIQLARRRGELKVKRQHPAPNLVTNMSIFRINKNKYTHQVGHWDKYIHFVFEVRRWALGIQC